MSAFPKQNNAQTTIPKLNVLKIICRSSVFLFGIRRKAKGMNKKESCFLMPNKVLLKLYDQERDVIIKTKKAIGR
jgi:hypothetical protein